MLKKEVITSLQNKMIKYAKTLQQKKYREHEKKFLVEGIRFCEEAIIYENIVENLFYTEQLLKNDRGQKILDKAKEFNIPTFQVENNVLSSISETETPQGIVAVCRMPQWNIEEVLENEKLLVFIIDRVQDPGNLGTIIRVASAVNAAAVFCIKGTTDIYSSKNLRATMGAVFHIPVFTKLEWNELLTILVDKKIKLIVGDLQAKGDLWNTSFPGKAAIVLGNEGEGVGEIPWIEEPITTKIPMFGPAESLNVSVAAGILAYEYVRQNS